MCVFVVVWSVSGAKKHEMQDSIRMMMGAKRRSVNTPGSGSSLGLCFFFVVVVVLLSAVPNCVTVAEGKRFFFLLVVQF